MRRNTDLKTKAQQRPIITTDDEAYRSIFTESYKTLRTNLSFAIDRPLKTILVTSSGPKEGKSTVSANLGIIMGQAGNRVLIVDTDLRIPVQHKIFGLDKNKGFTNFLTKVYNTPILEGNTTDLSVPDIFHLLKMQEKTGILTVEDHEDTYIIIFKDGKITNLDWNNRPEERRLGSLLIKNNKVTDIQREEALDKKVHTMQPLGCVLVNMGYIDPHDLEGPLTLHYTETLRRILDLKDAHYIFSDNDINSTTRSVFDYSSLLDDKLLMELDDPQNLTFFNREIDSILYDTNFENLKVIPSGPQPINPSELLASRQMKSLISLLKYRFDTIIFDSPPVTSVTDASILAAFLHGVIFTIKSGAYNRKLIMRAKQQLENVKANIYGVVLNNIDIEKENYYNYYRYQYQYYSEIE
ncbi:MAG: polysaccharide biosynthesis tyrosine autokinase [bacterium]